MKTTRANAGFVYGAPLPPSFIPANAACDDPNSDDASSGQAGEIGQGGNSQGDGSADDPGGNSADDAANTATVRADGSPDTADEWENDDEVQSVPKLKKLHNEAKRWRRRVRQLEEEAVERTNPDDGLRIEAASYRHAASEVIDLDAAMKLADLSAVTINDDGTVTGMDAAVADVQQRYPFLSEDPDAINDDPRARTTDVPPAPGSAGSRTSGRKPGSIRGASAPKALLGKFPALSDRRR